MKVIHSSQGQAILWAYVWEMLNETLSQKYEDYVNIVSSHYSSL